MVRGIKRVFYHDLKSKKTNKKIYKKIKLDGLDLQVIIIKL